MISDITGNDFIEQNCSKIIYSLVIFCNKLGILNKNFVHFLKFASIRHLYDSIQIFTNKVNSNNILEPL